MLSYNPQKALLVTHPPVGQLWIHELKLDGFRMGVLHRRGAVNIISRRGSDYTAEYPEIVAAARKLRVKSALLDGEVVVLDARGVPSFQLLQQLSGGRHGLAYFAFDLLELNGEDLRPLPLEQRKSRLHKLLGDRAGILRYTQHFDASGDEVFERACALGVEGIVSKRRDAGYRSGTRSVEWQKVKCTKRQEFIVGGFTDPEGSRAGVGSILIGYYDGAALRFAGKVGTGPGWNDAYSRKLRQKLERIETTTCPYHPRPPGWLGRHAHWVKPKLVVEVAFSEWTEGGNARHPSLQGFRTDKKPVEVTREIEAEAPSDARLVFPRAHLATDDLVALYSGIMDWALPHALGRPLTLVRMRHPITRDDALRSEAVFVHHTVRDQKFIPPDVPRIRIPEKKKLGEYCYVDSPQALLSLIEAGVVEWHVWNAKVGDVERPDRVVFDIDPGEGVAWRSVVEAARALRRLLHEFDLDTWVKTTGGTGLHVVLPFRTEHGWDTVFAFSRAVAARMAGTEPDLYTLAFDKYDRAGKMLIDYKRNYRTSIAVAGFSLRAKPEAPIAAPVAWQELGRLKSAGGVTANNIHARLARRKLDPWKDYWSTRQRLTRSTLRAFTDVPVRTPSSPSP